MKRNLEKYEELKKLGLKEREIAEHFGMSILDFRAWHKLVCIEKNRLKRARIQELSDQGLNLSEIAKKMNSPLSTIEMLMKRKETKT